MAVKREEKTWLRELLDRESTAHREFRLIIERKDTGRRVTVYETIEDANEALVFWSSNKDLIAEGARVSLQVRDVSPWVETESRVLGRGVPTAETQQELF